MKNFVFLFLVCLFFSCKKNSSSTSLINPPTNTPTSQNLVYGSLETVRSYYRSGTTYTTYVNYGVGCFFSSSGIYSSNPFDNLPAGAIYLNSIRLSKFTGENNFACQYHDSTFNIRTTPFTWDVAGEGIIPGFTTTINDPFPSFLNFSLISDTLSLSKGFTIQLSSMGADSAAVDLFLDSGASGSYITKKAAVSSGSLSYSAQEVTNFMSIDYSKYRSIRVSYIKYNLQIFGGKTFVFKTTTSYSHNVEQVP